jgi:hypothetical protein
MISAGLSAFLAAGLAVAGLAAAVATAIRRPRLCFGIVFLVASFSRATLETPLGTMRPEMPAVAAVGVILLLTGRLRDLRELPRILLVVAGAFAVFLASLAVSSALVAPDRSQSLHMVAWYAVSMVAGAEAFILLRPRPAESVEPLAVGAGVMGLLGLAAAAVFLLAGPGVYMGIQEQDSVQPRVFALAWEANLYGSFLAICAFFALETTRRNRRLGLPLLAASLVGFPLAITRGAWIGFGAGLVAWVGTHLLASGLVTGALLRNGLSRIRGLALPAAAAVVLLAVGLAASLSMLPNNLERVQPTRAPATSGPASGSPGPAGSGAVAVVTPAPTPVPTLAPETDTVAFRMERVWIAVAEIPDSPIIGFGAESFGQRHPDRYAGSGQDHIAILAVQIPYESGFIGLAALVVAFGALLLGLLAAARRAFRSGDQAAVGAAAAFVGAVVTMLVAYEVTTSLEFAVNWLVIGAAAALLAERTAAPSAAASAAPDGPLV